MSLNKRYKVLLSVVALVMSAALLVGCGENNSKGVAWASTDQPGSNWEIEGVVDNITSDGWLVEGRKIYNPGNTVVVGPLTPGTLARIRGLTNKDKLLIALQVNVSNPNSAVATVVPTVNPLPTVTPMPSQTASVSPTVVAPTATPSPAPTHITDPTSTPSLTATPTPAATAGLVVVGPIVIDGIIQNIIINNNVTVIVINNIQYVLPPEIVVRYGPSLKIGLKIKLDGKRSADGNVIIINVIAINNVVVAPVVVVGGDDEEHGKDKGKKEKDSPKDHDNGKGNDNKKPKK